jgi:hypothetical protein
MRSFLRVRAHWPGCADDARTPEMAIDITSKDQLNVHHKLSLDKQKSTAHCSKMAAKTSSGGRLERTARRQTGTTGLARGIPHGRRRTATPPDWDVTT